MANWFKNWTSGGVHYKSSISGLTESRYRNDNGGRRTRTTNTHTGKTHITRTLKSGGWTKRSRSKI